MILPKIGARLDPPNENYKNFDKSMISKYLPMLNGDVDLREFTSPRHNQRRTSSCTAQSAVKALEIKRIMKYGKEAHVPLSVMDLYYGARDLMDPKETDKDEGTHLYLVTEVLRRFGVCREELNPFDENNLFKPTSIMATRESYLNKIHASYRISSTGNDRVEDVINNLQVGNPVIFATRVGMNWMLYNSNSEPLLPTSYDASIGYHAICIVGWVNGCFIIENSWGDGWGEDGFAHLRPEVIADADSVDFWVMAQGSEAWHEKS